jgi:carboxy-terminal domain RNA polymerase II polypeptide A small phosphatase
MLLILDLDETLMHATETQLARMPDFMIGDVYAVYKRPYLDSFIAFCLAHFEVAVWTSSTALYAAEAVHNIFPAGMQPSFVWARNQCVMRFNPDWNDYYHIKDLGKIKRRGYDLAQVLVIDDSPEKLCRHYGNLIRILPFEGDLSDTELQRLPAYLLEMKKHANVRIVEKRGWRNLLHP